MRSIHKTVAVVLVAALVTPFPARAQESRNLPAPLVRGPGITQEQLEAAAEAQGRSTFADQLDLLRPGDEMTSKLHRLVERAQNAWLSGSIETARASFRDIVRLTLEADWRPSQREAIQYAYLRLAQSAPTPTERAEWLEKAVVSFPDLASDEDAFPPPVTEAFRATRSRLIKLAKSYSPYEHFPDHRYLLINGKRFVNEPDLKIRLPNGIFRVTALSDAFAPMTEKLSSSQLDVFRLTMPPLSSGTCDSPGRLDGLAPESIHYNNQIAVVFSPECVRTHTAQGWQARGFDIAETAHSSDETMRGSPALNELSDEGLKRPVGRNFSLPDRPPAPTVSGTTWLVVGASVLIAGAVYAIQKDASREQPAKIEPVHRTGF